MADIDPVLYWNDVALEANRVSHTNGKGEQTGPAPKLTRFSDRAPGHVRCFCRSVPVRPRPLFNA